MFIKVSMFCAYTRSIYQMSVCRTFGPLVSVAIDLTLFKLADKEEMYILNVFEFWLHWTTELPALFLIIKKNIY